jgi:hypothetical protein
MMNYAIKHIKPTINSVKIELIFLTESKLYEKTVNQICKNLRYWFKRNE